jgi:hypothetical protein
MNEDIWFLSTIQKDLEEQRSFIIAGERGWSQPYSISGKNRSQKIMGFLKASVFSSGK